jgi:hypothetical protein
VVRREEVARFAAARQPPTVVIGYDPTCSAPKSVSLLWASADEALRVDVAAAMDAGVDAAVDYLQRYAAVGTVEGRNRPGLGLAAACYRHDVSRADEAHLHGRYATGWPSWPASHRSCWPRSPPGTGRCWRSSPS